MKVDMRGKQRKERGRKKAVRRKTGAGRLKTACFFIKMHERQMEISYCVLLNAEKHCFLYKKCKKGLTNHHKLYTISDSE